jgi:hypothetical protein
MEQAWAVLIPVALILLGILLYKPFLLKFMPDRLRFQTVDLNRVTRLDQRSLKYYSDQFHALGFSYLGDLTNTSGIAAFNQHNLGMGESIGAPIPSPTTPVQNNFELVPGFTRVWYHPQYGCMAEAYQFFPPKGQPVPKMAITIFSQMTDRWEIITSNRRPEAIPWIMRRPRGIRTTHRDGTAAQLLQAHLSLREQLQAEKHVSVVPQTRLEDYVDQERRSFAQYKGTLGDRNSIVVALEAFAFNFAPKSQWLGEWRGAQR